MNDIPETSLNQAASLVLEHTQRTQVIRETVMAQAIELSDAFVDQRTLLQAQSGGEFVGLVLMVRGRNENRSIQISWVTLHFRQGKRTGMTSLPKPRSSRDFDLTTLKRIAPDWLHELLVETEQKARLLRDALASLTTIDRELKVIGSRLSGNGRASDPSTQDNTIDFPEDDHDQ